jgi:DNA-binding helix-hairpin-helix protein with protein kinase domain
VHINSIKVWSCLPDYVQNIFITAFGNKAVTRPSSRPKEIDWLNVLTRFRSDIVTCPHCGNEVFTQQGEPCKCDACGKKVPIPFKFVLSSYSIPAALGSRIYRCQLGVCDEKDALSPIAQVVSKEDMSILGVRNRSNKRWDALTPTGVAKKVAADEVIPLKDGISFQIDGTTITIKAN